MRRLLAIVLLALLPLQFSWAAVASYCGHEAPAGAGHFGHHAHPQHADAAVDAQALVDLPAADDQTPGALDVDCGHCHGHCSAMLTLPAGLPGVPAAALPGAATDDAGGGHTSTRPERPQWRPFA